MINASIIGANGYTGFKLMSILSMHKKVKLCKLTSRSNAGTAVTEVYPQLNALKGYCFSDCPPEEISKVSDVVFVCLPHGESAAYCEKLLNAGCKVIDLSADFRYKNLSNYEKNYVKHPFPDLLKSAVYGLPEIYKKEIKNAKLIGNPGCYTTCSILPLYPLLNEKLISRKNIIIDAKSGVSGAGRKAELALIYNEVNENFKAYSVTTHRHTSEIEEILSLNTGLEIALSFTPHLLPLQSGILSTIYADINDGLDAEAVICAYEKYYKNEPFVNIIKEGLPEIKHVRETNYINIGFKIDTRLNKIIIISCLDNLVKGASGQAVQNMNIMSGFDESEGLLLNSNYI